MNGRWRTWEWSAQQYGSARARSMWTGHRRSKERCWSGWSLASASQTLTARCKYSAPLVAGIPFVQRVARSDFFLYSDVRSYASLPKWEDLGMSNTTPVRKVIANLAGQIPDTHSIQGASKHNSRIFGCVPNVKETGKLNYSFRKHL